MTKVSEKVIKLAMSIKMTVKSPDLLKTDEGEILTEWKTNTFNMKTKYEVKDEILRVCINDQAICYYDSSKVGQTGATNLSVTSGKAPTTQN